MCFTSQVLPEKAEKGRPLTLNPYVLVASLSLALVLAVIALVREARLRRALQRLLKRLILLWRSHAEHEDVADRSAAPGDDRWL